MKEPPVRLDYHTYSSKIIKAHALLPDAKTLLSHWDAVATVPVNPLLAQQLVNQRLHVLACLARGDEPADVSPSGCEVPPWNEFEFSDGRLQLGSSGGEAAVEIVGRIVQRNQHEP